jgi:hypothetical protein
MAVQNSEFLKLVKQEAVFVQCRLTEVSSLSVGEKLVARFFDGQWRRLLGPLSLGLPSTN